MNTISSLFICAIMFTYFFQGNEEDSDETIGMKRVTLLFALLFALSFSLVVYLLAPYQGTSMIRTGKAADDEKMQVIFRSMKSAVSHFVGNKKYLSA